MEDSILYKASVSDSLLWKQNPGPFSEPYIKHYFNNNYFGSYPVVNITWHGANNFCKWLTDTYNSDPNRRFKKVIIRLPREEEWKKAASSGKKHEIFAWGGSGIFDRKGRVLGNFKRIPLTIIKTDTTGNLFIKEDTYSSLQVMLNESYHAPLSVDAYLPNKFGFFNMSGNVAEMLNKKGETKGGSWYSPLYYLMINSEDEYGWEITKGSSMVGFRYFMEVIEE